MFGTDSFAASLVTHWAKQLGEGTASPGGVLTDDAYGARSAERAGRMPLFS
jgi:hypothetical protein